MKPSLHSWLAGEISTALAAAFEGLTGERPRVEARELASEPATPAGTLRWRQNFSGVPGALWMHCAEADWRAAGSALMQAAGIEENDPAKLKAEFAEIIRQALSGAAGVMSARLGHEVVCAAGEESDAPAADAVWSAFEVNASGWSASIAAGIEAPLLSALNPEPAPEPAAPKSKTYDLLLDVELPVSVSFGRAQVALKDVLKLTTGSIVDLNRDIADPVEVIVNNCVIARGEVVVVGGNFGVRIQQVISRQERLRTLK